MPRGYISLSSYDVILVISISHQFQPVGDHDGTKLNGLTKKVLLSIIVGQFLFDPIESRALRSTIYSEILSIYLTRRFCQRVHSTICLKCMIILQVNQLPKRIGVLQLVLVIEMEQFLQSHHLTQLWLPTLLWLLMAHSHKYLGIIHQLVSAMQLFLVVQGEDL